MWLDYSIKLNQYISSLEDPTRFFVVMGIYIGIPLLLVFLLWLDKKIEQKKGI